MPYCDTHEIYFKPGQLCQDCNQQNLRDWRESKRIASGLAKKERQKSTGYMVIQRLQARLQRNWRNIIYPHYQKLGLTKHCWVNKSHVFMNGVSSVYSTPHVAHYFDKGTNPYLWTTPENSGIACYYCNCVAPQTVAKMEGMMIEVWGIDRIQKLKEDQIRFDEMMKRGQLDRRPKDIWYLGKLEELKTMTIS